MAASASSQFGLVLLFSTGTLLLLLTMAPQFGSALECYYKMPPIFNVGRPAAAALQWNKLTNLAKISRAFGVAANVNTRTIQCPAGADYCFSMHCQDVFGDEMAKTCASLPDGAKTPAEACAFVRTQCGDDPKFYCRYCNTDKCNNDK